jgi:hypothetical protein
MLDSDNLVTVVNFVGAGPHSSPRPAWSVAKPHYAGCS